MASQPLAPRPLTSHVTLSGAVASLQTPVDRHGVSAPRGGQGGGVCVVLAGGSGSWCLRVPGSGARCGPSGLPLQPMFLSGVGRQACWEGVSPGTQMQAGNFAALGDNRATEWKGPTSLNVCTEEIHHQPGTLELLLLIEDAKDRAVMRRVMDRNDRRKTRSSGWLYYLLRKEEEGHRYRMSMDPQENGEDKKRISGEDKKRILWEEKDVTDFSLM
ncbi:uncharacterized protein [Vicugna pacos]|uniref:Uncharacterized protein n=1 Tax=Vicugna pacos TaxID=30538 RepID=A0ABM5C6T4_VICPA